MTEIEEGEMIIAPVASEIRVENEEILEVNIEEEVGNALDIVCNSIFNITKLICLIYSVKESTALI